MIHAIRANRPTFRAVTFQPGFNVVLADITKESRKKDSRNGLGKTTLIEILHFCFGAQAIRGRGLCAPPLRGWSFTVDFDLGTRRVQATRSVDDPKHVFVSGDIDSESPMLDRSVRLRVDQWNDLLGLHMFGIPAEGALGRYAPTFRSLIGFFARRDRSAYESPFDAHAKTQPWNRQVNNAFLLGLAWEDAKALQQLRDREKAIEALKMAAKAGVIDGVLGDIGQLEADRVRIAEEVAESARRLSAFQVHDDYSAIEKEASALTRELHELSNRNLIERRRLEQATAAVREEIASIQTEDVVRIYEAAGIELPGLVVHRLEAVQAFHAQVVDNRRAFLDDQIVALERTIGERTALVARLADKRAGLLAILRDTGALEEYTALQQRHLALSSTLRGVESALDNIKKFEVSQSALKVEREQLHQRSFRDYEERAVARERAIRLFNALSQALFASPGRLLVNVTPSGFRFDVQIERARSQGVNAMQVFCYDLTIASLWAGVRPSPGFLVHDSPIFDGVDPRQRGRGIAEAAAASARAGFQYICTLNSDAVPHDELPADFDFDSFVRLRLTDATPEGSLLGLRF